MIEFKRNSNLDWSQNSNLVCLGNLQAEYLKKWPKLLKNQRLIRWIKKTQ